MSAQGRGATRKSNDFYATPKWCVDRLLESPMAPTLQGIVCEPCAGDGAIVRAVNTWLRSHEQLPVEWALFDIDERHRESMDRLANACGGSSSVLDFTCLNYFAEKPFNIIVSNPPYNAAQDIAEVSFRTAYETYLLLRVNFLGSQRRHAFFRKYGTPDIGVIPNRPSFVGGKTDATEYAWCRWTKDILSHRRPGQVYILDLTPELVIKYAKRFQEDDHGGGDD